VEDKSMLERDATRDAEFVSAVQEVVTLVHTEHPYIPERKRSLLSFFHAKKQERITSSQMKKMIFDLQKILQDDLYDSEPYFLSLLGKELQAKVVFALTYFKVSINSKGSYGLPHWELLIDALGQLQDRMFENKLIIPQMTESQREYYAKPLHTHSTR
jgi:hypothetical protein